jgi:hypothetical protein
MAVRSGTLGVSIPWAWATDIAPNARAATSGRLDRARRLGVVASSGYGKMRVVGHAAAEPDDAYRRSNLGAPMEAGVSVSEDSVGLPTHVNVVRPR